MTIVGHKMASVDLIIKEVPEAAAVHFTQIQREFEGHSGFAFKFLCDMHQGILPTGREEIQTKLDILAEEISVMKERMLVMERDVARKEHKEITTVGGRKISMR